MNATVALTGALPAVVLVSAVLTAVVSVYLLWLYRRSVLRAMNAQAGNASAPPKVAPASTAIRNVVIPVLEIIDPISKPETPSPGEKAYHHAMHSLNKSAKIYALGGLSYALVLTTAWMIVATGGFIATRFFWLLLCYSWPAVLAVSLINPSLRNIVLIAYFAIVLLAGGVAFVRNPDLTPGQLLYFWLFANGPGTVLLLSFLNRRIRAVGPLVLAFMVAAVTGAVIIVTIVGSSTALMRVAVNVGSGLGLGATAIFVLLNIMGFALFGLLGWMLLRRLGRQYQEKKMSDQSITLDALWLLFGVVQSFTLVFEGWAWIFTGAAAYAAYKFVVRAGHVSLHRQQGDDAARRTLLLLRVFALGRRSQRLFDVLSKVWLRAGSICLISGPDLVTTTVEPHEFMAFIGGRLSRQFVSGEADLTQRISRIDSRRDPDGRYRVNEFFCRADTWQMTMERLSRDRSAVLMDLRSFSKANQGCIFELRQLFNTVPLEQVVLVIDHSTDTSFLETAVREIWQEMESSSPNVPLSGPTVRCLALKKQSHEEMERLLHMLFETQLVTS